MMKATGNIDSDLAQCKTMADLQEWICAYEFHKEKFRPIYDKVLAIEAQLIRNWLGRK